MNTLTPQDIAAHFLIQYDRYIKGEEVDQVFTETQIITMIQGMKIDPQNMINFFSNAISFIVVGLETSGADHKTITSATAEFTNSINSIVIPVVFLQHQRIQEIDPPHIDNVWENLDFKMDSN